MRPFLLHALFLGLALGAAEVAIRVAPTQALTVPDVAMLLAVSCGLTAGLAVLGAAVLSRAPRPFGLHLGLFLGFWLAINYRFEYVLNEFVRDPRVWGGMSGLFLVGLAVGVVLDRAVRAPVLRPLLGLVAVVASGTAFVRATPKDGSAGPLPPVVIISLDTLRADRTSPYGHDIPTPTMQRLADEGATFEQAIAPAPITEPSHLAMLTGVAPYKSGIVSNGTALGDRPFLWHKLKEKGYLTAGFVAGFPLHSKYGWDQGMDVFDDDFGATAGVQGLTLVKAWNQVAIKEHALRERPAHQVLSRALPWLLQHRDEQFFAFLHFYDVHGPYTAPGNAELGPPPTDGPPLELPQYWPKDHQRITSTEWLAKAYDKEVELVDAALAQIIEVLGPRFDETIFIVTSDHGESFTEHDYLYDHGDNLYDPSLRIPLLVRYPKAVVAGTRIPCQVAGYDVAPTVLDLIGVAESTPLDGHSRKAWLAGQACGANQPVISSTTYGRFVAQPPVAHSLRVPGEKVLVYDDKDTEFFDLVSDGGETQNLHPSGRSRDAEAALRGLLASGGQVKGATMDAETCESLKALGYIDGDVPCGGSP